MTVSDTVIAATAAIRAATAAEPSSAAMAANPAKAVTAMELEAATATEPTSVVSHEAARSQAMVTQVAANVEAGTTYEPAQSQVVAASVEAPQWPSDVPRPVQRPALLHRLLADEARQGTKRDRAGTKREHNRAGQPW